MSRQIKAPAPPSAGSIHRDKVYTLQGFCYELKFGKKTWYTLRDAGLRSCKVGRQVYILGHDALDFFDKLAEQQAAATEGEQ